MFDVKAVIAEAQKEISEEQSRKAKDLIKKKLREIAAAELVLSNLKREMDDLTLQVTNGQL